MTDNAMPVDAIEEPAKKPKIATAFSAWFILLDMAITGCLRYDSIPNRAEITAIPNPAVVASMPKALLTEGCLSGSFSILI